MLCTIIVKTAEVVYFGQHLISKTPGSTKYGNCKGERFQTNLSVGLSQSFICLAKDMGSVWEVLVCCKLLCVCVCIDGVGLVKGGDTTPLPLVEIPPMTKDVFQTNVDTHW